MAGIFGEVSENCICRLLAPEGAALNQKTADGNGSLQQEMAANIRRGGWLQQVQGSQNAHRWGGGGGEGHWQRHPNEKAATRKDTLRSRCVPNCAGKDEHGYGCGYGVRVVNSLGKYPLLVKLHNPLNTPPCSNAHQLALMSKACWGSNWVLLKDSHRKKKLNQNGEVNIFGSFSQI